ncbi:MAG: hypothetical protein WKI04_17905 [Ferruginibacter sp.]
MNQLIKKHKKILAGIAACLIIGGLSLSFQNSPFGPIDKLDTLTDLQDTIPENNKQENGNMSMQEFDKLMQNMDKEMLKIHKEVTAIDFDKMHTEIAASLDKVDFDKIKTDIDKAMKEVNFTKIEAGVQSALKEIEWNKINNDVKIALQEAKKEIEKINMEAVNKAMEKAKFEIEKSKSEIKKINIEEIMKNANAGILKAKEELHLTKAMFIEMERDGIIVQREGFSIEYKNKELFINGKKQSETITRKYRQYIKGDSFKINISKE